MLDTAGRRHRREGTGETLQELYFPHSTRRIVVSQRFCCIINGAFLPEWYSSETVHYSPPFLHSNMTCLEWHTLCVRSVDIQNPLCAFHTFTVVSLDAEITTTEQVKTVTNIVITIENKRWQETAHRVGTALSRHQRQVDLSYDTFTHNSYPGTSCLDNCQYQDASLNNFHQCVTKTIILQLNFSE